ncbi:MAG TPA: HAMP domain-containing protein [Polyangiaceae bacterium]|nr:HAMP domain-containing protein [Polyangiaceae bacterium]
MGENSQSPSGGRHQRRLRNLLLDRRFQLKYTGYLVAITLLLSVSLGSILFRTSSEVLSQSEQNVAQGERIVKLGREVVDESRKVSAVVRMNIVKDPVYQNNPDLLEAFNQDAAAQDQRLESQRGELEAQRRYLNIQAESLRGFQRGLLWVLTGVLALLVVAIGVAGIVVTHRVAGPIYKMKRHLGDVAAGDLSVPRGLRKGDELVEFFAAFCHMVESLRASRESQAGEVERLLVELDGKLSSEERASLEGLRASLRAGLD